MADLYGAFSERFENDAEAAALFAKLSRASKTLKSQLEFLHRLAKSLEKSLSPMELDVARIARENDAVERIRGLLEHVNLEAAIAQSIQLECGSSKLISRTALGEAHPDLAQMIRGFGVRKDSDNPSLLLDLATKRGLALPPTVVAAANATISSLSASTQEAAARAAAAREAAEKEAAQRAAEEADLEAAIKAGKNAIDYRIQKKKPL